MAVQLSDSEYRRLLQNCGREIAVQTNLLLLLPILRTKGLLIDEEFQKLHELPSYDKGSHLVQILSKKGGEDAFRQFVSALKQEREHTGHGNLARKLQNEKENILSKRPPPTLPRRKTSQGPAFTPPPPRKIPLIPPVNNRSKSLHQINEVGRDRDQDEADSAPKIILDVVYSNAKQIDSEQQVMTKLSGDVYVQSQLKQINNNFTKKLDDMNAKMDVIQLAVQHLSNAVVVIHEKLESMENYVPASKHYSLQPSTMSSDSRVMNCNPSSERKPFNQHAPKMNTYVDTMGSANSTGEDIQAEGEVHSLSHTYEYVQISDRSTSMSTSQNTSIVKQNEHQYENSQPVKPFNKADYVEVKVLAHGQSGEFWLAVNRFNGWKVVTKKPKATISQELLGNEIHLLSLCQHPNVIRFISADLNQSEQTYSLFFEYAELGQLKCFLQNNKDNMNNGKLLAMALGVASGMIELGLKRIIYCDLQSSNILVDGDMVCKIASFNKAQYLKENETYKVCHSFQIATRWQAPEVFNSRKFSVHSDVWSFGVFLAELFFYGETPYPGMTTAEVKNFVLGKKKMEMPKECPKGVYSLMKECFRYRAEQRMTFTALHKALKTQHSIFSKKPSDGSSSEFED